MEHYATLRNIAQYRWNIAQHIAILRNIGGTLRNVTQHCAALHATLKLQTVYASRTSSCPPFVPWPLHQFSLAPWNHLNDLQLFFAASLRNGILGLELDLR